MESLIKITKRDNKDVVSARELHQFLGCKKDFSDWIKHRIQKYGLLEGEDFASFPQIGEREKGGTTRIEYTLTIEAAKQLAMVEGNLKGKEARLYFIECEKKLKQLSPGEFLVMQAQQLLAIERRQNILENKVEVIEAKITTRPDWFTVAGYAKLKNKSIGIRDASTLGKKAGKVCRERGISIEKTHDPRFGEVNTYPSDVLEEIFLLEVV